MDQRIEAFLTDVLALAGEEPDAVREGVRVAHKGLRGALHGEAAVQAHEGPNRSRRPRALRRRGP
jgi:hypothetical protein